MMALESNQLRVGACYSNGEFGKKWIVWQVSEIFIDDINVDRVRYRILVGTNRRKYMVLSEDDFINKMRYEVELMESTWQRVV